MTKDKKAEKNSIKFQRDTDGNLYAVKEGKTISKIKTIGDRRK